MEYEINMNCDLDRAMDDLKKEKNGEKALMVLHIISYFTSDDIQTGMFLSLLSDSEELKGVLKMLEQRSLIRPGPDESIVISKTIQNQVRNYLKKQKMEVGVLKLAMRLLFENSTHPSNLYHAISVCSFAKEYPELVNELSGLPSVIVNGLIKHGRYKDAGLFGNESFDFLKKTIGEQHPAVLTLQHNLSTLLGAEGKYKEALKLLLPLYEQDCKFSGQKEITETLVTIARQLSESSQYAEALHYYERIFAGRALRETNDKTLLTGWHDYALLLNDLDFTDRAENILQELLLKKRMTLDEDDDEISRLKMGIGHVLLKQCKYREALKCFCEVYDVRRVHLGDAHEDTLRTRRDIALCLQHLGEYDNSLAIYKDVTENFDKVLGKLHPDSLATRANLASIFLIKREYEKAYEMYKDVYEKQRITLGETQLETLRVKHNIGSILLRLNRKEEALEILEEVLEGFTEIFGPENKETIELRFSINALKFIPSNLFSEFNQQMEETQLCSLAKGGNFDELLSLIQNGTNINIKDNDGNTPLHKAVEYGHSEIVKLLLKHGAIYNPKNSKNITPLGLTSNPELKKLFTLVEKLFTDVKDGNTQQILESISVEGDIINARDHNSRTPLHWAASEGHRDIVQILLERGADATMVTEKFNTPLHIAVSKNRYEIIQLMLKLVKDDQLNKILKSKTLTTGNTPLHVAAEKGYLEAVQILLKHGAAFDLQNKDGKTALKLAKQWDIKNLLSLITMLFNDAEKGDSDIINKLVNIGTDELAIIMNVRNNQGHTLMQTSIVNKHSSLAKRLLKLLKEDKSAAD